MESAGRLRESLWDVNCPQQEIQDVLSPLGICGLCCQGLGSLRPLLGAPGTADEQDQPRDPIGS